MVSEAGKVEVFQPELKKARLRTGQAKLNKSRFLDPTPIIHVSQYLNKTLLEEKEQKPVYVGFSFFSIKH